VRPDMKKYPVLLTLEELRALSIALSDGIELNLREVYETKMKGTDTDFDREVISYRQSLVEEAEAIREKVTRVIDEANKK